MSLTKFDEKMNPGSFIAHAYHYHASRAISHSLHITIHHHEPRHIFVGTDFLLKIESRMFQFNLLRGLPREGLVGTRLQIQNDVGNEFDFESAF
jgi:hypothetical protein